MLTVGLLINPLAGIGGPVALKGSDGVAIQKLAQARGGFARAPDRARRALRTAAEAARQCRWLTVGAEMGASCLASLGLPHRTLVEPAVPPTADDTRNAARLMLAAGADLLLFAGGDGTARDLLEAVGERLPVLGIPAGVKMHSGVFAATPERAGELLARLVEGGLVGVVARDVRDLDEVALRAGEIRPRYFGVLQVPELAGYLQHTKERGRENEALAVTEIVADVVERLASVDLPVVLGPGSTVGAIKRELGFEGTVLGFDVWQRGRLLARDVDARWLLDEIGDCVVIVSFSRGQGFLLGRGNQQLSPAFLRRLQPGALWVVGTRTKLASLEGRPLLVDTDDPALDRALGGLIEVTAGYQDRLLHRVDTRPEPAGPGGR